jgi:excisionase family DNA binding protein
MRSTKSPPAVAPTPDSERQWLTTDQAAAYLCVSPQTIRAILHRHEIRAVRLGPSLGGYHIDKNDLDKWLERRKKVVAPHRRNSRPWVAARWAKQRKQSAP